MVRPGTPGAGFTLTGEPSAPVEICEGLRNRLALPVPEVAKLLGISSGAIRNMIARGEFPGRHVGGGTERVTYIVPTGALLRWLEAGGQDPARGRGVGAPKSSG